MGTRHFRATLLASLLATTSCDSRPAADVCARYWPDVALVEVSTSVRAAPPQLRLEEMWRAGGSTEGQELAFPASVALSSRGYTAVVDPQLAEVIVLTPDGQWLGSWARRGRGPGELTMPVAANWRGDTLLVFDVEQAKVSIYAAASVVVGELRIAPEFISPVAMSGEIDYVAVRSDGSVLLKYPLLTNSSSSDTAALAILAQRPGAAGLDTVASVRLPVIRWGRSSLLPQPGAPQPRVAVGANGWLATSAADGTYRILMRDAQNTPVRQICRVIAATPLTPAEIGRGGAPAGFEEAIAAIAKTPAPHHLSQIGRIIAGPAGELWVDRKRPTPFTSEGLFGVPGSTLDVFDKTGAFVGEVRVPAGVSVLSVSGAMAVGVQFTELDEPWIIGYRVLYPRDSEVPGAMSLAPSALSDCSVLPLFQSRNITAANLRASVRRFMSFMVHAPRNHRTIEILELARPCQRGRGRA